MAATSIETSGQDRPGSASVLSPAVFGIVGLLGVFAAAYRDSILWMAGEWSSSGGALSHGYLVAAISAFLLYRALPNFAARAGSPAWWLLPAVAGLSFVWLLGHVAAVVAVQTVVLPAILLVSVAAAFGVGAARSVSFPILYLYFAVPAWDHLQFVFQWITVVVVAVLVKIADIPALVEGNLVMLPVGTFQIAGGCSGLSFIVAGLSLAVLYSYLYYSTLRQALLLTVIALLVAMLGNWLRVFAIIVIGYKSNMQSGLVDDHLTFGWIVFSILMIPVFFIARRLENGQGTEARHIDVAPTASTDAPREVLGLMVAAAAMLLGPAWAFAVSVAPSDDRAIALALPSGSGEWQGPHASSWDWQPQFRGAAAERVAEYRSGERFVLSYTNLYLEQKQGRELIFSQNRIGGDWREVVAFDDAAATAAGFRQITVANFVGDWLIWYRYQLGSGFETSEARAKFRQAVSTLKGTPEAGIIAFSTPCYRACESAAVVLRDFVNATGREVRILEDRVREN